MAIDLDDLADKARSKVDRVLRRIMRDAVTNYERTGTPGLPSDASQQVDDMLRDIYKMSITLGARDVQDGLKDCFLHLETKQTAEELFQSFIDLFMTRFGAEKVVLITDTTRKQIRRVVQIAQDEGLGVAETAKQLRDAIPTFSATRSAVIARTETHASSQFGSMKMAEQSSRPLVKRWSSVQDDRTRALAEGDEFGHRSIDGQTVAMEQAFQVPTRSGGTEPLMFPGAPEGSAGNVINCRCAMTYRRADRD